MPLDKTGPILTTRKPLLADLAPLHAHVSVTAAPEGEDLLLRKWKATPRWSSVLVAIEQVANF
ncbi:hypothetical protein GCM10010178_16690 [Lentzea flava]|uniref:Uncharacterized protein n=1 Tax=Lentzea flava TaxID=103732 RepID=A0ABQ2UDX0_9PSEU|nr:hypothetical protein GCM10010178_16690 [Lentzea flava]